MKPLPAIAPQSAPASAARLEVLRLLAVLADEGEPLHIVYEARGVVVTLDIRTRAATTFIPRQMQRDILEALDGRAMRTDALAAKAGYDRRKLYRKPGGLEELKERGLVANHHALGYYRPDAPPPELIEDEDS